MRKLLMNLGGNAFKVLGPGQYSLLLLNVLRSLPQIFLTKNCVAVDKRMSRKLHVLFEGYRFAVDCQYIDNLIRENSFTFGLMREIYIRNCYLKHHQFDYETIKTVVDLGANRGIFSVLAANFAEYVICVEVQKQYNPVIRHTMHLNSFHNFTIENVFIGSGGAFEGNHPKTSTLEALLQKHSLEHIDFLKIDIEGSEFALFEEMACLDAVKYLSMEVHRKYGDVREILAKLKQHGFQVVTANQYLEETDDVTQTDFIYAAKT